MSKTVGTSQPVAANQLGGNVIQPEPTFVFPVQGQRALISFRPRNTSFENLCAGVIVKQDNGDVTFRSAFDDCWRQFKFDPQWSVFGWRQQVLILAPSQSSNKIILIVSRQDQNDRV